MPRPIASYALIGDGRTSALVGDDGSIDWLCVPRFDSPACFTALLGGPEHGRWRIAPTAGATAARRRYRDGTMILETEFETGGGAVRVIDCMPISSRRTDLVRIVEGIAGRVAMRMELVLRFDYGTTIPWVRKADGTILATAGPDTMELRTPVEARGVEMKTIAEFEVGSGDRVPFILRHWPSHESPSPPLDPEQALRETESAWVEWSGRSTYRGRWRPAVQRSLLTLKALIYEPTGGIVAAPTTSLPERRGGTRNWDYRYCWVRDAAFTLNALLLAGYTDEAMAWREWLLRAVAGSPEDLQVLYGVAGERRLPESELGWLPGYDHASPVRVGNAAANQFQLDIFGEVMDTLHMARAAGLAAEPHAWRIQLALLEFLAAHWHEPDDGIWEVRGPRRRFTYSRVMAWVAFDRAVKAVEHFGLEGPVEAWRATRAAIHAQICASGFDARRQSFVQHDESSDLDASLLLIPLVGFLPADDPRVRSTVEAIQGELMVDGFVKRYADETRVDGLPPGEGAFLPCTFWLVDCLALMGRRDEAERLFERLLALRNDVGLLSEEREPGTGRMLGNFPQALSHMALVNTARLLTLTPEEMQRASRTGERPAAVALAGND